MTDGRIPEGRKPLTDADLAALTRRLAGTAVDYKELYEAAKRDAEEAEAYAAELEAQLDKAVEVLEAALKYNSAMHGGAAAYNQRIKDAIAELKGGKHE
jgi:hypothetical protein